jgi:hypothetical protein
MWKLWILKKALVEVFFLMFFITFFRIILFLYEMKAYKYSIRFVLFIHRYVATHN